MDGLSENGPSRKVRGHDGIGVLRVGHRCGELIQHSNGALCRQSEHWEHAAGLGGETGDLTGSKVGAVGAPDQNNPTTAPRPAPVIGIRGVTRKRAAGIAFPAARGARAASSDEACAAQSPAPTEHSSKRKRASASGLCQSQSRNRAADCRSSFRQRTTETALEMLQQEARDSAAKVEFLKACFAEEACGAFVLALFDQFCAR